MTDFTGKKIQSTNILFYATTLLALGQSISSEIRTTDNGHRMVLVYFMIEVFLLGLVSLLSFRIKWTRMILGISMLCEAGLFLTDKPIGPDELLVILLFVLRIYILVSLFSTTMNQYYRNK